MAGSCADHDLDQEFYNDYLDSLPDERVQRKQTLEANLLRVARVLIPREDPDAGPAFVRDLKAGGLRYGQVKRSSPFVRGIMKEMPYLKETPYMWIVSTGRYMIFVTYKADPRRFLVAYHQTRTILKKKSAAPASGDQPAKSGN